jgi:hypothetical protein
MAKVNQAAALAAEREVGGVGLYRILLAGRADEFEGLLPRHGESSVIERRASKPASGGCP